MQGNEQLCCVSVLLTLLLLSAAVTAQLSNNSQAAQVLSCLQSNCGTQRTHWDDMVQQVNPCLSATNVWWSTHTSRLPVTLITQLSINRLSALQAQCSAWAGPLAAAVYVPLLETGLAQNTELSEVSQLRLQNAKQAVQSLMDWAEVTATQTKATAEQLASNVNVGATLQQASYGIGTDKPRATCQLRILLVYEVLAEEKAMALYPVNMLRNYARLMADTPLIANVDVDMLPSFGLSASLLNGWKPGMTADTVAATQDHPPGSAVDLLNRTQHSKTVFVVPAFETRCGGPNTADQIAGYTKARLRQAIQDGCADVFRRRVSPRCHRATNFPLWFNLPGAEGIPPPSPYGITHEDRFEPWFIGHRSQVEWFDVRYRGYGKNKIEQVAHTAYSHTIFMVHPTGFLVHRPHHQSSSRKAFIGVKYNSRHNQTLLHDSLYQHIENMWKEHYMQIKGGRFKAQVDTTLLHCLEKLPWWGSSYSSEIHS